MKRILICIAFALILTFAGKINGQDLEKVVINPADSISGYYLVRKPQSGNIKGVLILLPGFGQSSESVFLESKLPNAAYINNLLTITIAEGNKLYADSALLIKLNSAFSHAITKFSVDPENFVIGGYSAGGTIALRYAELCQQFPERYPIKLKAVFAIDSPVDLIEIYRYFEREIARNYSTAGIVEARLGLSLMQEEIETPECNLELYKKLTPFYKELQESGNEKYLHNMGVRTYHDVDINWYLKERQRSAFDMNFLLSSEMINRLVRTGNTSAEFIQSNKKGVRINGLRHPHSWNIVEEEECIQWVNKQLESKK